jgi:hypothetical protein
MSELLQGEAASSAGSQRLSWQERRDAVRALIRREVERAGPIDDARRSLELIAESSVRAAEHDGELVLEVVDEHGMPRRTEEGGTTRAFTLPDLIQELRGKHPKLFKPGAGEDAMPAQPAPAAPTLRGRAVSEDRPADETDPLPIVEAAGAVSPPAATPAERDWLDVGSAAQSPRAALTSKVKALEATRRRTPSDAIGAQGREPLGAAMPEPKTGGGDDRSVRWRDEPLEFADLDERFAERLPRLIGVAVVLVLLAVVPYLAYSAFFSGGSAEESVQDTVASAPASEETTSSVPAQQAAPEPKDASPLPETATEAADPLKGVPEVLDTATLVLDGKVIPLFGVEWVRGAGSPEELTRYLNGREVACDEAPSPGTYRCQVDSQDLSKVVLYNGGGRAKPDATPELKAAEDAARSAGRGVWAESVRAAD